MQRNKAQYYTNVNHTHKKVNLAFILKRDSGGKCTLWCAKYNMQIRQCSQQKID
jgi:hypothetical protein